MLAMIHSAVVFDFLLARLPLTTRYLCLLLQKAPYPFPTSCGSITFVVSVFDFIISHDHHRGRNCYVHLVCVQSIPLAKKIRGLEHVLL